MAEIKVLIGEIDGQELEGPEERVLDSADCAFSHEDFDAANAKDAIIEAKIRRLTWQLHKTRNGDNAMSNASWFDAWPARYASGSYSGFGSNAQPLIVPFDCKLVGALVTIRRGRYDWISSEGSLFIEFGFYTMVHNGHTDYCRLGAELEGDFSGNDTGTGTHKWCVNEFTERVGSNSFSKHDVLGVQFRKDISQPGQLYTIYDPIILLDFEEI